MHLSGKTALVTSASRGEGLALTAQLLRRQNRAVAGARNPQGAEQLQRLWEESRGSDSGGQLEVVQLEVGRGEGVAACVRELKQRLQHLDLVVNNAGVMEDLKPVEEETEEEMLEIYKTNALGPFLLTRQLKREGLVGQPGTQVVNVSTILGSICDDSHNAFPRFGYRASKAALNILTKHLDLQLAPDGITCVAIHPGYVRTDINHEEGDITPEQSARGGLEVLESGRELHGRFYAWDGRELPW